MSFADWLPAGILIAAQTLYLNLIATLARQDTLLTDPGEQPGLMACDMAGKQLPSLATLSQLNLGQPHDRALDLSPRQEATRVRLKAFLKKICRLGITRRQLDEASSRIFPTKERNVNE